MLRISLFLTASGQRSFEYRATSLWDKLQPELKLSESVKSFKRQLRRLLLDASFSYQLVNYFSCFSFLCLILLQL